MLHAIHLVLVIAYAVLPVAMIWWTLRSARTRRVRPIISLLLLFLIGIAAGITLMMVNGHLMSLTSFTRTASGRTMTIKPASFTFGETARLCYFIIGALCLVRLLDRITYRAIFHLSRVKLDQYRRPVEPNAAGALFALLTQRVLMLTLIIPYFIALMMVYRPRVHLPGDPGQHNLAHQRVSFRSNDGINLSAWWITARAVSARVDPMLAEEWGQKTVLLCHGLGSAKERQLDLAAQLAARGFNVLVFDFRGHGESGGNFISYGIRERFDVLAAVQWIKANHPKESQHLYGVGANTGAAALLGAATNTEAGQQIEALVLYEPFSRFDAITRSTAQRIIPGPASWLVQRISLPLASLHAGGNLRDFAPVDTVDELWPRPVLIIHGRAQTFVPVDQSLTLHQQASQPKDQFFPSDNYYQQRARLRRYRDDSRLLSELFKEFVGTSDAIFDDPGVRYHTVRFLEEAEPVPVL
jgi:pimeloyl-ACP methyl ester carboxylesterase